MAEYQRGDEDEALPAPPSKWSSRHRVLSSPRGRARLGWWWDGVSPVGIGGREFMWGAFVKGSSRGGRRRSESAVLALNRKAE
jgi:hypothetical protein